MSETTGCTCGERMAKLPNDIPWFHAEACPQYRPAPTKAEQMAVYDRAQSAYEADLAAWRSAGEVGPRPPHPVKPHTPSSRAPSAERSQSDA